MRTRRFVLACTCVLTIIAMATAVVADEPVAAHVGSEASIVPFDSPAAAPQVLPIHPVGPEVPKIHPVGPEVPPKIHPVGPEVPPHTQPVGPEKPHTQPVGPERQPTHPVGPERTPTKPVGPERHPTEPVGPERHPTHPVGPEIPPTEPASPTHTEPTEPAAVEMSTAESEQEEARERSRAAFAQSIRGFFDRVFGRMQSMDSPPMPFFADNAGDVAQGFELNSEPALSEIHLPSMQGETTTTQFPGGVLVIQRLSGSSDEDSSAAVSQQEHDEFPSALMPMPMMPSPFLQVQMDGFEEPEYAGEAQESEDPVAPRFQEAEEVTFEIPPPPFERLRRLGLLQRLGLRGQEHIRYDPAERNDEAVQTEEDSSEDVPTPFEDEEGEHHRHRRHRGFFGGLRHLFKKLRRKMHKACKKAHRHFQHHDEQQDQQQPEQDQEQQPQGEQLQPFWAIEPVALQQQSESQLAAVPLVPASATEFPSLHAMDHRRADGESEESGPSNRDAEGNTGANMPPPPSPHSASKYHSFKRWAKHHKQLLIGAAVALLGLVLLVVALCVHRRRRKLAAARNQPTVVTAFGPSLTGALAIAPGQPMAPAHNPFAYRPLELEHEIAQPVTAYAVQQDLRRPLMAQ